MRARIRRLLVSTGAAALLVAPMTAVGVESRAPSVAAAELAQGRGHQGDRGARGRGDEQRVDQADHQREQLEHQQRLQQELAREQGRQQQEVARQQAAQARDQARELRERARQLEEQARLQPERISAENHGQIVSEVARETPPGPDHGQIVSEVAGARAGTGVVVGDLEPSARELRERARELEDPARDRLHEWDR